MGRAFERFFERTKRSDVGTVVSGVRCLEWQGPLDRDGYGHTSDDGRTQRAHRWAYERFKAPIPARMHVLHKCDNPRCVEVAHLYPGTDAQNTKDRVERGRCVTKLTAEQVIDIRQRYASGSTTTVALAQEFGVNHTLIGFIVRGQAWKHVGGVDLPKRSNAGARKTRRGEDAPHAKLRSGQVVEIRTAMAGGGSPRGLALKYGVTPALIRAIAARRIWKHVG